MPKLKSQSPRTWFLIADAAHARILETREPGEGLHQLANTDEAWLLPPSHEILSDRAGRTVESHGSTHHAYEGKTDPHRELKRAFARHLVGELMERLRGKAFDRLVIVAPPVFLGDLRAAMTHELKSVLAGEVDKDLTHVPTNEIGSHLTGVAGL